MTIEQRLGRAHRSIGDHGITGVVRLALKAARDAILPRQLHVWYVLDLDGARPESHLPEGFRLENPTNLTAFDQLGAGGLAEARGRVAAGGSPWLLVEDERVAFACWILPFVPTRASSGGQLELPESVRCLEYSITLESYRGRGLAPAAWGAIADALEADGCRQLTTKVGVHNVASRRAVEKAGFREVAVVSLRRRGLRLVADVDVLDPATATFITDGVRR
jgi:hypothetical protein